MKNKLKANCIFFGLYAYVFKNVGINFKIMCTLKIGINTKENLDIPNSKNLLFEKTVYSVIKKFRMLKSIS